MTIYTSARTVGQTTAPEPFDMNGTADGAVRMLAALREAGDRYPGRPAFTATVADVDTGKPAAIIRDGGEDIEFYLTTVRAA